MLKRPLMFVIPVPVLLFGCPCGTLLSLATAYLVVRTCCVVRTFLTGFDLVLILRIVFSISHFCGLPPNFLVTVPFLRSASFQQPRFTWPCIYSASFKLLLLRHMTLLVFSHQRTTLFHKKLWNLPYGYCRIGSPRSCR